MVSKGVWIILAVALLLAGCGGNEGAEEPTIAAPPTAAGGDAVATSVQQTVAAIAVAQTVAALTSPQPTLDAATAAATAIEPPPTEAATPTTAAAAPSPTAAPITASPTAAAGLCRVIGGVNLRPGPGVVYNPPLASLGPDTQLTPLAYVPVGYPQGPWLLAQVQPTGQLGWVSALPQYLACDSDPALLPPPDVIPPTPVPPPTAVPPTPTRPLASAPPDIDNDAPGGNFPSDNVLGEVIVNPTFLFRMDVRDLTFGNHEGAGINFAEFSITGDGVDYFRREGTAGYCVFGGGEPTCNPWPTDDQGRYTWGEGGPLVQNGEYFASITVDAQRDDPEFGNSWNWNFPFRVTLP